MVEVKDKDQKPVLTITKEGNFITPLGEAEYIEKICDIFVDALFAKK